MAHTRTWDTAYEAIPSDTEFARLGASRIRNLRADIRERMELDHDWSSDLNTAGRHKKTTLEEQASDPTAIANYGILYTKDVAGTTELFYRDSAGNVIQITVGGNLEGGSLDAISDAVHGDRAGGSLHADATNSVDGFMSAADKTKLDGIESGAEVNWSAAEIRALGFFDTSNDGVGSGLDADQLDGQEGSYYRNASNLNAGTVPSARLPAATTSVIGALETATDAETRAETAGDKIVTPSNLAAYTKDLSSAGYCTLPGGLVIQWGTGTASSSGTSNNFPTSFPNGVFQVLVTSQSGGQYENIETRNYSTSSFIADCGAGSNQNIRYIAIGY